jgi:hypothetical protein
VTDYQLNEEFGEAYMSLMDMTGRELKREKITTMKGKILWQTEQMKIGLYFITLVVDNHTIGQSKVSIQK